MTIQKSSEPCPKCGQLFIIAEPACSSCGLIFSKWEQKTQGSFVSGSQRMELAWQDVINQWINEPTHKKFVDQCSREHNLPFASQKYKKVLESDPHSEIAQKMQKKIQELVIASFMTAHPIENEAVYSNKSIYVVMILAALMVLLGLGMPKNYLSAGLPLVLVGVFAFVAIQLLKRYLSQ